MPLSYMASVGAESRGRRVELEVAARLSRAKQAGDVGERIDLAAVPSSKSQAVGKNELMMEKGNNNNNNNNPMEEQGCLDEESASEDWEGGYNELKDEDGYNRRMELGRMFLEKISELMDGIKESGKRMKNIGG